jgi:hypothetical protein
LNRHYRRRINSGLATRGRPAALLERVKLEPLAGSASAASKNARVRAIARS